MNMQCSIFVSTENGCLSRLERKLIESAHAAQGRTGDNGIIDCLCSHGVSFETSVLSSECDITSCFESDSRDGKLLFDSYYKGLVVVMTDYQSS